MRMALLLLFTSMLRSFSRVGQNKDTHRQKENGGGDKGKKGKNADVMGESEGIEGWEGDSRMAH